MLTEEEDEQNHEKAQQFAEDFAKLVRKYIPTPIRDCTPVEENLLARMQDMTSCYSPYVWSEEFDPGGKNDPRA